MYMKRHLLKFDYLFCIILVCSEPQQVFKNMEYLQSLFYNHISKCYSNKIIVLQQTLHIVTHTGPHRVTSSNIHQIKALSLGSSKLHDATVRTEGEIFYGPSTEGTPYTLV